MLKEDKAKKDAYEKALSAYGDAIKELRKGRFDKAKELFLSFLEKHDSEKELVDRVQIYLSIIQEKGKKETFHPKTFDDYYQYSIYWINKGDYESALKLLENALGMKEDEGKILYLLAEVYCLMGQAEMSLESLKKAIQKDKFYRILAQNEIDFEPLWEDKKFKLITRMT